MPCCTDGALPTITPGGHIVLAGAARCLIPAEKLLLHCLPLHRMVIPEGVSDGGLECMGGNMMHLHGQLVLPCSSLFLWLIGITQQPEQHQPNQQPLLPQQKLPWELHGERQRLQQSGRRSWKARFGMLPMSKKVGKRSKLTNFNALLARMPEHKACLCGTRWAC